MKARKTMDNIRYSLLSIWKADKSLFLLYLLYTVLEKVQPFIFIFFPKVLLDNLGDASASFGSISLIIVVFILLMMVVMFSQRYVYSLTSLRFMTYRLERKSDLSAKTMEIEYENLEDPAFLDLCNRAQRACMTWDTGMEGMLRQTIGLAVSIASVAGFIAILLTLGWIVCVGLILISVAVHFIQAKLSDIDMKYRERMSEYQRKTRYFSDVTTGPGVAKDIRMFHANSFLTDQFKRAAESLVQLRRAVSTDKNPLLALTYALDVVKVAGFFLYLTIRFVGGGGGVGSFVMYITTFSNFTTWFDEIIYSVSELKRMTRETDDYRDLMELPVIEDKSKQAIEKIECIAFNNVWFKYKNMEQYALKDMSFTINANEAVSLVGANGSGKTTIVKLICGFYMPTKGEVLINGIPIQSINRKSLCSQLAAVFQDVNIFAFPIGANVALRQSDEIDEEKVIASLEGAGFGRILDKAPRGIDTVIKKVLDDDGMELSGGENQGIGIARTIYKDESSVLILDEPTSHLDALTESRIYSTYNQISNGRISLFISHRLASAQFCDRVLFIEDGAVMGFDTHEQLMQSNPLYLEMYNMQAKYYQEGGEHDD